MDVELSELVKQFQALQHAEVPNQISERNAVEIVNELVKKKLIELLYTTDAKEYLTWDELKREIIDEVVANGGRLNVVDLPGLLTVHGFQVERALPSILQDDHTIRLESGELMTNQYLDSTLQAASDELKEYGSLTITQFAITHRFSSAFSKWLLEDAINSGKLSAVLQDSALYTTRFVRSQSIVLRAGLLAVTQPVDLNDFVKRHNLFAPLLSTLVDQVRDELPGLFDNHLYTPAIYERQRAAQVENVFASNGFVEYATLQKMGISNARQYMQRRFNPPISPASGGSSQPAVVQKRSRKKGMQAKEVMDNTALVHASEEFPLCGYALSSCFLTDRYLSNMAALRAVVDGDALAVDLAECFPLAVDVAKEWPLMLPRLRELYVGVEQCELVSESILLRADVREKVTPRLVDALTAAHSACTGSSQADVSARAESAVQSVLSSTLELPLDRYEEELREIAALYSDVVAEVARRLTSLKSHSDAADLKHTRAAIQVSLASSWMELCVAARGLQWASGKFDEPVYTMLCRHTLSTRGYILVREVLLNESLDSAALHAKVAAAVEGASSSSQLKSVLQAFPERTREALTPLVDSVNGKSVDSFMGVLHDMSSCGTIAVSSFYAPNRKAERDAYAALKESGQETLRSSVFSADVKGNSSLFALLCTMAIHSHFRIHLEVPGKAVRSVVALLAASEAAAEALAQGQEAVAAAIQSGSADDASVVLLEELRQSTLALLG